MTKEKDAPETLSLEEALTRLEEITGTMEKETLPLEDMLALYKEGRKLEERCRSLLNRTEQELEILSKNEFGAETEA
ncbi:MAG: exodeoxyribonuclease VII small subunit [Lachnospiraceae bacterium]|nr:exodeoxyribonuclease VII small subunit [Lachnospiraceae bacterium]